MRMTIVFGRMVGRICAFFVLSANPVLVDYARHGRALCSNRMRLIMTISHKVGLLLFPKITQLDLAGPYEVFSRMPGAAVHLLWKDSQPITSEWGLELRPDTSFEECPALDVLCIPGGPGAFELLGDDVVVNAVRTIAQRSRF